MFKKIWESFAGSKKTTVIGILITIITFFGVESEAAQKIAEAAFAVLVAVGFLLSKDGNKS